MPPTHCRSFFTQEANALQRNQEARRENELLQHEGRVRESLIPVLLDLIQRSHNPAQNTVSGLHSEGTPWLVYGPLCS